MVLQLCFPHGAQWWRNKCRNNKFNFASSIPYDCAGDGGDCIPGTCSNSNCSDIVLPNEIGVATFGTPFDPGADTDCSGTRFSSSMATDMLSAP